MVIRGGTVVTATGERAADVLVDGEKIVEVGPGIHTDGSVLDATGLLVLPGIVDPHTHLLLDTGTARRRRPPAASPPISTSRRNCAARRSPRRWRPAAR